jgi:TrwC relaxase
LDATEKGHTGLASYYTERGETPGAWIGSGMDGIDGLAVGDPVTAEQMRALFDCGLHLRAELRQQQQKGPELSRRDLQEVTRLGVPFKIVDRVVSPFRLEVAKRIGAINTAAGLPADAPLPAADRSRVRTEVAREFSWPSMAASSSMPESWRDRSRKTHGRGPRQLPVMT